MLKCDNCRFAGRRMHSLIRLAHNSQQWPLFFSHRTNEISLVIDKFNKINVSCFEWRFLCVPCTCFDGPASLAIRNHLKAQRK